MNRQWLFREGWVDLARVRALIHYLRKCRLTETQYFIACLERHGAPITPVFFRKEFPLDYL